MNLEPISTADLRAMLSNGVSVKLADKIRCEIVSRTKQHAQEWGQYRKDILSKPDGHEYVRRNGTELELFEAVHGMSAELRVERIA